MTLHSMHLLGVVTHIAHKCSACAFNKAGFEVVFLMLFDMEVALLELQ